MKKKILITGGAGFLGSHLCKKLVSEGNYVICADNFLTGNIKNIQNLLCHPDFELLEHDITIPLSVKIEEIYNLACPASPVHYQFNPVQTTKTAVIGAVNMLELAKQTKARILQASTSEIYGDPEIHPQPEKYNGSVNPIGIRACYDEGKRCAETLFFDYFRKDNVKIKVMRIFNTYGPNMSPDDGRVVSNFIMQALNNRNITIYGDGSQSRSFCYVDDLIEGMVKFMSSPCDFTGPVNIGNPDSVTIKELAEIIIKITGSKSEQVFRPLPLDDPRQRCPVIDLAEKELDWKVKVSLEEGLKKTVEYFRNRH